MFVFSFGFILIGFLTYFFCVNDVLARFSLNYNFSVTLVLALDT